MTAPAYWEAIATYLILLENYTMVKRKAGSCSRRPGNNHDRSHTVTEYRPGRQRGQAESASPDSPHSLTVLSGTLPGAGTRASGRLCRHRRGENAKAIISIGRGTWQSKCGPVAVPKSSNCRLDRRPRGAEPATGALANDLPEHLAVRSAARYRRVLFRAEGAPCNRKKSL